MLINVKDGTNWLHVSICMMILYIFILIHVTKTVAKNIICFIITLFIKVKAYIKKRYLYMAYRRQDKCNAPSRHQPFRPTHVATDKHADDTGYPP